MKTLCILFLVTILAAPALSLEINEIRIDHSGTDTDEYFELVGTPGESLDGLFYIVVGDGAGGSGVLESITDLNGLVLAADGLLSVHKEGTLGACGSYDVELPLNFENSDNVTHMLVSGLTGVDQEDLDTDDDGVFDVTPWTGILDSISIIETIGSGDMVYGMNEVGPDGTFVPAHVLVCGATWVIGAYDLCVHDSSGEPNDTACAVGNEATSFGELKVRFR